MKTNILLFGIVKDVLKKTSLTVEIIENSTVKDLKQQLVEAYPQLKNMSSYAIAINESYATEEFIIEENDIIAIIPPVSGG